MDVDRWIVSAKAGDITAFNRLVDFHQAAVYHVAWHHSGRNADDALDACQESMLSAWKAIASFEGDALAFRRWLVRIVINACRDRLRYERRRPRLPIELERDGVSRPLPLPDPGQSPEDYARTSDLRALLEHALAQLSVEHRTVILLDHEGFDYREMADVLDVEVGTVKSRLSRARARMRDLLTGTVAAPDWEPSPAERRSEVEPETSPGAGEPSGTRTGTP